METKKLYYEDCARKTFCATVTGCEETEKGWAVTLDATAFYPEGGGQACDTGTLGGVRVLDVRQRDQTIVHLCDGPLMPGQTVTGSIDWERRLDQMQQHAGEHIVSGIIHQLFGLHNVGFHVGADVVTIDFDGPLTPEALAQVEIQANRAVWEDLPIRCWYPAPEELPQVVYRSKKALPWPVRIVEIPGCDTCACCGVHVSSTGRIGMIKLLSCVKFHQGVRIEMACGGRAFDILSRVYEQNRQVSQAFSAKLMETGSAARKMNEQLSAEKFRAAQLERRIFDYIAAGYAGKGDLVHFEQGLSPADVRELCDRIARDCGGTAAVFSGTDGSGYALCLVSKSGDVKALGTALTAALGGRGGGKSGFFQGSVPANREQILCFLQGQGNFMQNL